MRARRADRRTKSARAGGVLPTSRRNGTVWRWARTTLAIGKFTPLADGRNLMQPSEQQVPSRRAHCPHPPEHRGGAIVAKPACTPSKGDEMR